MQNSLFAPAPRRNGRIAVTLMASLLFHGSLIGVAAFWPARPIPEDPGVTIIDEQPPGFSVDKPALPPEPIPTEPNPVQPELKIVDQVDALPPPVAPDADDMLLSSPKPTLVQRTASRMTAPATATRATRTPGTQSSTGVPAGVAAGGGGAGSGVRWNKPKPTYPSALRLARVQGSGVVRVTTDGTGKVVNAIIVQSTGNAVLDDNTCRSARSFWSGPPNATLSVPITYQLQ